MRGTLCGTSSVNVVQGENMHGRSIVRSGLGKPLISVPAVALGLTMFVAQVSTAQAGPTIEVGTFWFCDPSFQSGVCETTVPPGSVVTWTWVGPANHNVTECGVDFSKGPSCTGGGGPDWASPTQTSGTFLRPFDTAGEFFYLCTVHPVNMRGKIIVSGEAVGGVAELPGFDAANDSATEEEDGSFLTIAAVAAGAIAGITVTGLAWSWLRSRT